MEKLIGTLIEIIKPPWNYILGFVALLIVVVPRLIDLRQNFLDERTGRRNLELEKLQLEVLKLRAELKLPVQHPGFTSHEGQANEIFERPQPIPIKAQRISKPHGRLRRWLERHSRIGRPVLLLIRIFLAYLTIVFTVGSVAVPLVTWHEKELGHWFAIFASFFYAGFAWLSYKGFKGVGAIRKELSVR